jgi:ribosomal protein S18 acetylase RimI-like enzyme
MAGGPSTSDPAERALAWHHGVHAAVCDVIEPWEHGTIVRATRYPNYYDFNAVRVERNPAMGVDELIAVADRALAGLEHRRIDFDDAALADPLRAEFDARGWKTLRLLWMRHEGRLPPGAEVAVEEVPYDAVDDLRVAWHREDFPDTDPAQYHVQAREVAMRRQVQVLAVRESEKPIAFAQLEREGPTAEITQVYVHPHFRGGGRGTVMTRAAIEAAGDARDLWIVADDDDRPKELYARLGFRGVRAGMNFLRLP